MIPRNPRVFVAKALRRLRYELLEAPRGDGKPMTREAWEKLYREGEWEKLDDLDEVAHYAVIAGFVRTFSEHAIVWDMGCGHGRLLQLLHPHFSSYTGVDISAEAIERAIALQLPRTSFVVSPFEDWSPEGKAELIIFNESISYTKHPAEIVRSYCQRLTEGGRMIISLVDYGNHRAVWKRIAKEVELISGARIENTHKQIWDVRLVAPRTGGGA